VVVVVSERVCVLLRRRRGARRAFPPRHANLNHLRRIQQPRDMYGLQRILLMMYANFEHLRKRKAAKHTLIEQYYCANCPGSTSTSLFHWHRVPLSCIILLCPGAASMEKACHHFLQYMHLLNKEYNGERRAMVVPLENVPCSASSSGYDAVVGRSPR
jgi:hypothetical protein